MHKLESAELNCLRAIANGLHSESGTCSQPVLAQLLGRGYIINRPTLRLPLVWLHPDYSITEAGKGALHSQGE